MGNLVRTATRVEAKGNDLERRLLMLPGSRCFLLKRGKETSKLESLAELVKGWKVVYSNFNATQILMYADITGTFSDLIAQASWIGYGVPADSKIDVYVIAQDRKDVVPPVANDPNWKIFLTREPKERYTFV